MEAPRPALAERGALHHGGHPARKENLMLLVLELVGIAITAVVHVVRAVHRA